MPIEWKEGTIERPAATPEGAEITPVAPKTDSAPRANNKRPRAGSPLGALARRAADARKAREAKPGAKIVEMDDEGNRRPIALFVYAGSTEAKYAAAKAACEKFVAEIFKTFEVSTQLKNFVTLRIDGTTLDKELRSKYGIRKGRYPQLILYDCTGKRIAAYASGTPEGIAAALKSALERSNRVARRLAARRK